jgi:RNA polymerase-binding transcription factor DksA
MASARKKSATSKAPKKSKPAPKPSPSKAAKSAGSSKTAKAKVAAKKPVPVKGAKSVPAKSVPVKAVVKATAVKVAAKSGKPVAAPAKAAAKPGKPAAPATKVVKGAKPLNAGALKAAALKAARLAPPPPPAKPHIPRLVPATAEARAAAALAARQAKPGVKGRNSNRPEPEVRPLGVLPPSSQAKPRTTPPPRPMAPVKAATPSKGAPKPAQVVVRKGDDRLTEADLKYFEQRLLTERRRIMGEMGHLESTVLKVNPRDAAGELSGYSYHMADAGTDSMEREKAFDIASKEGRLLLEIDEALRRLYNGTYGICEISGKPISRTRLDALPWARLSIDEQEKLEREKRLGRMTATDKE